MSIDWVRALTLLVMIGSGVMAGVFFAFSSFVMQALGRLSVGEAVAAMQSINSVIVRTLFMFVFFATALGSLFLLVYTLSQGSEQKIYVALACLLYLVGVLLVTGVFNVPLNNALAGLKVSAQLSDTAWADYAQPWIAWNHLRTIAALAASVLFALVYGRVLL